MDTELVSAVRFIGLVVVVWGAAIFLAVGVSGVSIGNTLARIAALLEEKREGQ